jgi:hypothetical protein
VTLDQLHHLARRVPSRMAAPGNPALGDQDRQVRLGARLAGNQLDERGIGVRREPRPIGVGIADRRRQADPAKPGRKHLKPSHRQRQQVAALLPCERVKLVDDDCLQAGEQ